MKARKDNKSYTILEQQKEAYLKQGYDIYDDRGTRLEVSPLKKITYQQHLDATKDLNAKITELETALTEKEDKIAELESKTVSIPDTVMDLLQGYAKAKGIDTGSATSEAGVLAKITDAEKA